MRFDPAAVLNLSLEIVLVGAIILALFRLRHRFGLGLLYIFVGSNQYLQTVLASTLYIELGGGVALSPGSVVLFSATLFAVLLTYLREDVPQTRVLIYGIVLSNVTLTLLAWYTNQQIEHLATRNLLGVPQELFSLDLRTFLVGTATLVVDAFLIVIVYEILLAKVRLPLFGRVTAALLLVLWLDALVFTTGSFYGSAGFGTILAHQLLGKTLAGVLFGTILYAYLAWRGEVKSHGLAAGTGVLTILTYRQRYEIIKQQLKAAEEASLAKSQFLAHMSHELRTPLNAVIGFTGVLLKNKAGNLSEKDLLYLSRVSGNAKHLLELINGLLDLSRIESGRIELNLEQVSLIRLIEETLEELRGQAFDKEVELAAELPAREVACRTDRSRLKQVLINLVGNALKFTERGGVTVRLVADEATRAVRTLEVTDTGIGIPEDKLGRVFEAFEQAELGTARRFGGTGLGLTISRALCEQMGYRLEVASREGRGSTFRIVMD